jgi:hypothetical protein
LNIGLDVAMHKYLTAGGSFAYSRYDYRSESLTYLTFAARGTFHPTFWFQNLTVPLDPYAVLSLGYSQAI